MVTCKGWLVEGCGREWGSGKKNFVRLAWIRRFLGEKDETTFPDSHCPVSRLSSHACNVLIKILQFFCFPIYFLHSSYAFANFTFPKVNNFPRFRHTSSKHGRNWKRPHQTQTLHLVASSLNELGFTFTLLNTWVSVQFGIRLAYDMQNVFNLEKVVFHFSLSRVSNPLTFCCILRSS